MLARLHFFLFPAPLALLVLALTSCGGNVSTAPGDPPLDQGTGGDTSTGSGGRGEDTTNSGAGGAKTGGADSSTHDPNQVGDCHFEDQVLARAIRERLPEGNPENLHQVSSLSLGNEVNSLEGIGCLSGLEDISLFSSQQEPGLDLAPLAEATSLRVFHFNGARQYDHVEVLAGLPLTYLRLADLDWSSLDALEGATSVEIMSIEHTPARDLSALASFKSLSSLTLDDTFSTDLSPLAHLDRLSDLTLRYMSVKELPRLGQIDDLRLLSLYDTDISSLQGLTGAPALARIDIQPAEHLETLAGLEGLPSLEYLVVLDSILSDISALSGSTSLKTVELVNGTIEDITALGTCKNVKRLNLTNNQITDIAPLAGLSFEFLGLAQNQVVDLEPLSGASVGALNISENPISSLDPIATLQGFFALTMDKVGATSLDFLADHELMALNASGNQIEDVSVLSGMSLHGLDLTGNNITTVPTDFVDAEAHCAKILFEQNPLDAASIDLLETLCSSYASSTVRWDGGGCSQCPDLR